jgi:hypothetical protein
LGSIEAALDKELSIILKRGDPIWWLSFVKCSSCDSIWLLSEELTIHDNFILRRISPHECSLILTNQTWPSEFEWYETLLDIAVKHGKVSRYLDPVNSIEIEVAVEELLKNRIGMTPNHLSRLLNVDLNHAEIILDKAKLRRHKRFKLNFKNRFEP